MRKIFFVCKSFFFAKVTPEIGKKRQSPVTFAAGARKIMKFFGNQCFNDFAILIENTYFCAKGAPEPLIFLSIFMLCHHRTPKVHFRLKLQYFSKHTGITRNLQKGALLSKKCSQASSGANESPEQSHLRRSAALSFRENIFLQNCAPFHWKSVVLRKTTGSL